MRPRINVPLRVLGALMIAALIPIDTPARGDEPLPAVFSPSDLPRLSKGVALGAEGERTVRAWSTSNQTWSLSQEGDVVTIRSEPADGEGDGSPRWAEVGKVTVPAEGALKIVAAKPAKADDESNDQGAKKKEKAEASPPSPFPALLVVDSDADRDLERLLEAARGNVESDAPGEDRRRDHSRSNQEGAGFQAPATPDAWRDRAEHLREQMRVTLGLWPEPPKTPLNPRVFGAIERDGYTIEKVVLETLPGFTLSGNLYRPADSQTTGQKPAILCPHGHWKEGRVVEEVQQRCIRWAKLGAVVFAYDMVGYNDSQPFPHEFLNDRLQRWGYSLASLQTWNSIRALDWISTLPDVDPARIGCTGASGGGTQTFLLAALDDRVKVAAPVVMVSEGFQGGCVCENAAGLRHGTDNVEFAALAAPRPMILVGATGDWTKNTMTRVFPAIRGVYSLVGAMDRLEAVVFDYPHNYNQTSRNAVYAFMGRHLLGIKDAESTREKDQSIEKGEDLLAFNDDNPAPERKTPEQLEDALIQTLGEQIEALAPAHGPVNWQASKRFLATALRVRAGLDIPSPEAITHREIRRVSREGFSIVHAVVGRRSQGEAVPVVRLVPAQPSGRVTIIAADRGKLGLVDPLGEPTELVKALLGRGQTVVGFDPLFVGESIDPSAAVAHRPEVVHFRTYNPSVAADQMQDLATVATWARNLPDVREVSLIARGAAGFQALVARPLLDGIARTAIDLDGRDDDGDDFPAAIDLPGLHQFGGLKGAAAMTSPAPLWLVQPGAKFDRAWPQAAYEIDDAPAMLRVEDEAPPAADLARWIDAGE